MTDMAEAAPDRRPYPTWIDCEERSLRDPIPLLSIVLLTLLAFHRLFLYLNYPILSVHELIWNAFVYIIPSRLVFALKPQDHSGLRMEEHPSEHASKSEILTNIFKLGNSSLSGSRNLPYGTKRPAGLGNWDNSCYQNSILQALASLEPLSSFLALYNLAATPHSTTKTLLKLIKDLNDARNSGHRLWTPAPLKSMSSWQQQDAQEYFSKILESVEKDTTTALEHADLQRHSFSFLVRHGDPKITKGGKTGFSNGEARYSISEGDTSMIGSCTNPLEGLLAQRVGCVQCGYVEGISAIPFNCMTLPLGTDRHYDLGDRLDAFTALDTIEGVECVCCTLLKAQRHLQQLSASMATISEQSMATEELDHGSKSQKYIMKRLETINKALEDEDFSENTLQNKCGIQPQCRVNSTKSRQAVVLRAPKCLVLHLNRSLFDESSGILMKNYADVKYDVCLDFLPWCIGGKHHTKTEGSPLYEEKWEIDPKSSMLGRPGYGHRSSLAQYQLQAVVSHYGRHENGHYICYRKLRTSSHPPSMEQKLAEIHDWSGSTPDEGSWWRISDDNVSMTTESEALSQSGAFMLFYEQVAVTNRQKSGSMSDNSFQTQRHSMQCERHLRSEETTVEAVRANQHDLHNHIGEQNKPDCVLEAPACGLKSLSSTDLETSKPTKYPSSSSISLFNDNSDKTESFKQPKMRTAGLDNVPKQERLTFKAFHMIATS